MLDPAFFYKTQPIPRAPEIKVYTWQFLHLEKWEVFQPLRFFWRLYWNPTPGAVISCAGKEVELTPGIVILIPPVTDFQVRLRNPVDHLFIHFLPGEGSPRLAEEPTVLPCPAVIPRLMESDLPAPKQELLILALLLEVLAEMPERRDEGGAAESTVDPRILKALHLLDTLPPRMCDNRRIAKAICMATSSYQHLFRKQAGISPQKYLTIMRLERARRMLKDSSATIPEIALRLGFADRYHFSAVFTRHTGISPAAYRKQNRVTASGRAEMK